MVWSPTDELIFNTNHVSIKRINPKFKSFNHVKKKHGQSVCVRRCFKRPFVNTEVHLIWRGRNRNIETIFCNATLLLVSQFCSIHFYEQALNSV